MYSHDKKVNNLFSYWLIGTLVLVFTTIIIGGLTRLTDSGLSITEWELFKGFCLHLVMPPGIIISIRTRKYLNIRF